MTKEIKYEDWHGLYGERWQGEIYPDAIKHPAKFARGLIKHIYQVAIENSWLKPGDTVIDPFGGVALGSLDALVNGLTWIGVELEQEFVDLGEQNIQRWREAYRTWPNLGAATIIQGDSRYLTSVIGEADGSISSPPFLQTTGGKGKDTGGVIDDALLKRQGAGNKNVSAYGETPGQLHNLSATDEGFDAAISSPPYAETRVTGNGDEGSSGLRNPDGSFVRGPEGWQKRKELGSRYGESEGQLGTMKDAGFDAAITSPPFEGSNPDGGYQLLGKYAQEGRLTVSQVKGDPSKLYPSWNPDRSTPYAPSDRNLGNEEGEEFWTSARSIIDQLLLVLKPGAHAIWVCKRFVKNGEIVDFSKMWYQVCIAAGFEPVVWYRAWVVEDLGTQYDLMGNPVNLTKSRKSFFRRLAEKNGAPEINWEDVIVVRKPT